MVCATDNCNGIFVHHKTRYVYANLFYWFLSHALRVRNVKRFVRMRNWRIILANKIVLDGIRTSGLTTRFVLDSCRTFGIVRLFNRCTLRRIFDRYGRYSVVRRRAALTLRVFPPPDGFSESTRLTGDTGASNGGNDTIFINIFVRVCRRATRADRSCARWTDTGTDGSSAASSAGAWSAPPQACRACTSTCPSTRTG